MRKFARDAEKTEDRSRQGFGGARHNVPEVRILDPAARAPSR
jgi:hypothetical protein